MNRSRAGTSCLHGCWVSTDYPLRYLRRGWFWHWASAPFPHIRILITVARSRAQKFDDPLSGTWRITRCIDVESNMQRKITSTRISLENHLFRVFFSTWSLPIQMHFSHRSVHYQKVEAKSIWGMVRTTLPVLLEAPLGQQEVSHVQLPSLKPIKKSAEAKFDE